MLITVEQNQTVANTPKSNIQRVNSSERRQDSKRVLTALSGKQKEPNRGQGTDRRPATPSAHRTGPTSEELSPERRADAKSKADYHTHLGNIARLANVKAAAQKHLKLAQRYKRIIGEGTYAKGRVARPDLEAVFQRKKAEGKVGTAAAMTDMGEFQRNPVFEAKTTHTHKGHCQVCGHKQAVDNKNGHIAKHGYTLEGHHGSRWFKGGCHGSKCKPLEHEHNVTDQVISSMHNEHKEMSQTAEHLKSGKMHPKMAKSGETYHEKHPTLGYFETKHKMVPFKEAPKHHQEEARQASIWHHENVAKHAMQHAKHLETMKSTIHGKPLEANQDLHREKVDLAGARFKHPGDPEHTHHVGGHAGYFGMGSQPHRWVTKRHDVTGAEHKYHDSERNLRSAIRKHQEHEKSGGHSANPYPTKAAHKEHLGKISRDYEKKIDELQAHYLKIPHEKRTEAQSKVYYAPHSPHHWRPHHSEAAKREFPEAHHIVDAIDKIVAHHKHVKGLWKEEVEMTDDTLDEGFKNHMSAYDAHEFLHAHGGVHADFHELRSHHVDAIVAKAKEVGYRKGKHAPGSTGRMFHQALKRHAEKTPSLLKRQAEETIVEDGVEFLEEGIYVGHKNGEHTVFNSKTTPTQDSHGHLYHAVTGPFRTRRGAHTLAAYGGNNPHIRSVADAERIGKAEQDKAKAAYKELHKEETLDEAAMKIKPEHYEAMKSAVHRVLDEHPNSEDQYKTAGHSAMRHRWDALHASKYNTHEVYKYANDKHIDTALKHIVKSHSSHTPGKLHEGRENEYSANQHLSSSRSNRSPGHYLMRHGAPLHKEPHKTSGDALKAYKGLSDTKGVSIHHVKESGEVVPGIIKTLSELSKTTLAGYVGKAAKRLGAQSTLKGMHRDGGAAHGHYERAAEKTSAGIKRALKGLQKEEAEGIADHTKNIYHKTLTAHGFQHHRSDTKEFAGHKYTEHHYTHPAHGKSHVTVTHWHKDAKPHGYIHRHEQSNGILAPSSGENPNQLHRSLSRDYGVPKGMKAPKLTKWEERAGVKPYKMNEDAPGMSAGGAGDPGHVQNASDNYASQLANRKKRVKNMLRRKLPAGFKDAAATGNPRHFAKEEVASNLKGHVPDEIADVDLGVVSPEKLEKNEKKGEKALPKKVGAGGVDEATLLELKKATLKRYLKKVAKADPKSSAVKHQRGIPRATNRVNAPLYGLEKPHKE